MVAIVAMTSTTFLSGEETPRKQRMGVAIGIASHAGSIREGFSGRCASMSGRRPAGRRVSGVWQPHRESVDMVRSLLVFA